MGLKAFNYSTYMPVLISALLTHTAGDVLEMGCGPYSTPLLHWLCYLQHRQLMSVENNIKFFQLAVQFANDRHTVIYSADWDTVPIEKAWGVAFIDHAPPLRRKEDIRRLVSFADIIVVHDACGRDDRHYRLSEIYPLFKYQRTFTFARPRTVMLSNRINVNDLVLHSYP